MVHLLWDNIGIQNVKVNPMYGKVHFDKVGGIRSVTVDVTERNLTNERKKRHGRNNYENHNQIPRGSRCPR